jgi:hypothetical protein
VSNFLAEVILGHGECPGPHKPEAQAKDAFRIDSEIVGQVFNLPAGKAG